MNNKVDIYCATLWRQGHVLRSLKSISQQPEFGTATITCNNWTDSEWKWINQLLGDDERITLHRHNNEKCSNEKLRYIGTGTNKYIMLMDDDLIYAPDYLSFMINGCEKYNAYVSLHGVIMGSRPIRSYYRDRMVFRGLKTVLEDVQVDLASNCGCLFKREFFTDLSQWYDMVNDTSMDDIFTNYFAKKAGVRRMVLAHQEGYIVHKVQKPEDDYVFDKHALVPFGDIVQTTFINENWDK